MWVYNQHEFTSEMIGEHLGFVYQIRNKTNNMKYIGKKMFKSTRKLKPLKGKKRKRTVIAESDWKTYYGSSEAVKAVLEEKGDIFERIILKLCDSKGELSYEEARLQFLEEVLLRPDYYNGIINCRINRTHVKKLHKE
jgi:hypothetical protein